MLKTVYENQAQSCMILNCLKESQREARNLKMIQGVGKIQEE